VTIVLADATAVGDGFDWSILATPSGVVLGALIAGTVAWRSARKSVYERLELLAKIRKDWPDGLGGADTVDRSINLALAEIRKREKHDAGTSPAGASPAEQRADRDLEKSRKTERRLSLIVAFIGVSATLVSAMLGSAYATQSAQSSPGLAPAIVTLVTVLFAGLGALVTFRNR
jgi:hypothetical protein